MIIEQLIVRQLSKLEIEELYLPLRLAILQTELRYVDQRITTPSEMRDQYDDNAVSYGVFYRQSVLGIIRLIIRQSSIELPSGKYLPLCEQKDTKSAEISRAIVAKPFRGIDIFSILVRHACIEAVKIGVTNVYATIVNSRGSQKFADTNGFDIIGESFIYSDELCSIPDETIALKLRRKNLSDLTKAIDYRNQLIQKSSMIASRIAFQLFQLGLMKGEAGQQIAMWSYSRSSIHSFTKQ